MRQSLGERLRLARLAKGISQGELASAIGVSRTAIGQWELNGVQPSLERLDEVSRFLDVKPEWIAFGVSDTPDSSEANFVEVDEVEFGQSHNEVFPKQVWKLPFGFVTHELMISDSSPIIFRVSNNAMAPELTSGDRVIVDRGQSVIDGGLLLIWNKVAACVARVHANPSETEDSVRVVLGGQSIDMPLGSVVVLGKVVGRIRSAES
ncbi:helix-turn-helix domain-containing protein [Ruegeria arenilitoris]|uniref:helix-turn-helix domain-containing protein n=1 Tax=Ruegeria arenilitoris TaxID=1173585 RepID=UPI003464B166